jgi:hypothetical protein
VVVHTIFLSYNSNGLRLPARMGKSHFAAYEGVGRLNNTRIRKLTLRGCRTIAKALVLQMARKQIRIIPGLCVNRKHWMISDGNFQF